MTISIRDVQEADLPQVLALNNAAGSTILALTPEKLRFFFDGAVYFRVAVDEEQVVGFLIAMDQQSHYTSSNYLWFKAHYADFIYVDRIVVGSAQRGAGLGRIFYADVTSFAEVRAPLLACEVFLQPRNDALLLFHGTSGFQEAGQHVMDENGLQVSLLVKELSSFPWVREHYGRELPDQPWLAPRQRHEAEG